MFVTAYLHSLCLLPSHLSALSVLSLPVDMVASEDKVSMQRNTVISIGFVFFFVQD